MITMIFQKLFQKLFPNYKTRKRLKKEFDIVNGKDEIKKLNNLYGLRPPSLCYDTIPIRVGVIYHYPHDGKDINMDELQHRLGKELLQYCELHKEIMNEGPSMKITATIDIVDKGSGRIQ